MLHSRLAQLLKEKKITQAQLAEKVGATIAAVGKWCSGAYTPPDDKAALVASILGVTVADLDLRPRARCGRPTVSPGRLDEEAVKLAAAERGLSLSQVATLMDIHKQHLHQLTSGQRDPAPATLRKLARVLKKEPEELLSKVSPSSAGC